MILQRPASQGRSEIAYTAIMGAVGIGAALGVVATLLLVAAVSAGGTGRFFFDYQTLIVGLAATLVAVVSAVAGWLSFRTAELQVRVARIQAQAAAFPERMAVYQSVKDFLRPWFRDGVPDLNELGKVIDAWERSKFLFDQTVTDFLRRLWLDAADAWLMQEIIAGRTEGDRAAAARAKESLTVKYLGGEADRPDILAAAFKSMKIETL